jgi:hypothetical protein
MEGAIKERSKQDQDVKTANIVLATGKISN